MPLTPHHVTDLFTAACRADPRIVAAFLGGSHARGAADAFSDLDLYLITADDAFDDFLAGRDDFIRLLGEPLFLEDFDLPDIVFFILAGGVEGELGFGRESRFDHLHAGPHRVLVDKTGILDGATFRRPVPDPAEQVETLRRLIYWFFHDLSHFITAMGRGQWWWAAGQLEALRRICVSLARLRRDFSAGPDVDEPYFKIEKELPVEQLAPLEATFVPPDGRRLRQAGPAVVRYFQEIAPPLARAHGVVYPAELERIMLARLEALPGGPR